MDGGKDKMSARDCLRKIAFSVYSQPRFLLPEHTRGFMQNSMTRFGPASAFGDILDALRQRPINVSFKPFKVKIFYFCCYSILKFTLQYNCFKTLVYRRNCVCIFLIFTYFRCLPVRLCWRRELLVR